MTQETQAERVRAVEVIVDAHQREIAELQKLNREMVKFVAAQTALNQQAQAIHREDREERWQVWVRWIFNPGLPIFAILALLWRLMTETM